MSALAPQEIGTLGGRASPAPVAIPAAPPLTDRLRARLHAYVLDTRLASGERTDSDRLLTARAWQLTRGAARNRLAGALDAVLDELDGVRGPRGGSAVPIDRDEAQIARSELIRL